MALIRGLALLKRVTPNKCFTPARVRILFSYVYILHFGKFKFK